LTSNPENWERLFDEVPVDTAQDEQQTLDVKEQVMDAYDESRQPVKWKKQLSNLGQFLMTSRVPRYAATAAALIVATWFFVSLGNRTAFAVQDVIDTLLESQSVSFVTTVEMEGQPSISLKGHISATGQVRQEMGFGKVSITDFEAGKVVVLDPNTKTAIVVNLTDATEESKTQMRHNRFTKLQATLREARENPDSEIEQLGKKEIDGKTYQGFRIDQAGNALTVWADPDTNHPFLIETGSPGPPPMIIKMGDFVFDQESDPSLFDTTVPEGYRLIEQETSLGAGTEASLTQTLKMYCKLFDDEFPNTLSFRIASQYTLASSKRRVKELTRMREAQKDLPGAPRQTLNPEQLIKQATEESNLFMEGIKFIMMLPKESEGHYAGNGIRLDEDDNQPIFWYRPVGQDQWRVLGADLKFRDTESAPEIESAVPLLPLGR
jgi:outer membrane lipoprotein-sorting protein